MDSFDVLSSDSEEGILDEIVVGNNYQQQLQHHHIQQLQRIQNYQIQQLKQQKQQSIKNHIKQQIERKITKHNYAETSIQKYYNDNSIDTQENLPPNNHIQSHTQRINSSVCELSKNTETKQQQQQQQQQQTIGQVLRESSTINMNHIKSSIVNGCGCDDNDDDDDDDVTDKSKKYPILLGQALEMQTLNTNISHVNNNGASTSAAAAAASGTVASATNSATAANVVTNSNQLTTDMCNFKNSKSRRLEYSLKCLKYGRSNPSQDSAFGSLTDNELSTGSSSFRINSFQSISSPIDEGVEDVIIATTTAGKETCLELATVPRNMVSQDSAISSPCRECSPNNFLHIDDGLSACSYSGNSNSSSLSSTGNIRPQHFPVSLSPKILVTATTNSSQSSLSSININTQQATQQFDPPKILVNDQNSIYTTSPSKRSSTIEVFSQKYRVSSFEDMSLNKQQQQQNYHLQQQQPNNNDKRNLRNVNRLAFRSLEEERRIDSAFKPMADRTNSDNLVNHIQNEKYKKLTHSSFRISKTSSQVTVCDYSPRKNVLASSELILSDTNCLELQRPLTSIGSNRQTIWRDSKFYRKHRIAKSNDSLMETSPNHSIRLSPSSLRDSRKSLNRGSSIHEINDTQQSLLGLGLTVTTSFCGRRYCSSKSEDLCDDNDYLRIMDTRKSYSERHLVTLTKLKQTAINNSTPLGGSSEQCHNIYDNDMSFNNDNNTFAYKTTAKDHRPMYQHYLQRSRQYHINQQQQHQPKQHHQYHYHQHNRHQQQQQQQQLQHLSSPNYLGQRPHPNQLSWSNCSINRLKTTNIKTTSLATLSCQQNFTKLNTNNASTSASTNSSYSELLNIEEGNNHQKNSHCDFVLLAMNQSINNSPSADNSICDGGSDVGSFSNKEEVNNSSNETSPLHQTSSGAELTRIFAMSTQGINCCSEEKTPLLDNVEMSPISPTDLIQSEKHF